MIKKLCFFLFLFFSSNCYAVIASWDPNPPEDRVIDYTVYWLEEGTEILNKIVTKQVQIEIVHGIEPGRYYTFYVTARNDVGSSEPSEKIRILIKGTTPPPNPEEPPELPDDPSGIRIKLTKPAF